jgi:V/A-type H+-transporting ATPase subunit D
VIGTLGLMTLKDTRPTRADLLAVKRRLVLASQGRKFLEMKREVLLFELIRISRQMSVQMEMLAKSYRKAQNTIAVAEMMEGSFGLTIAAVSVEGIPGVSIENKNLMGLMVPVFSSEYVRKDLMTRGYGLLGTTSVIDEAAESYEQVVEEIVQAAEGRATLILLLNEINRLSRRVNALDKRIIPNLLETRSWIEFQREEQERYEKVRLLYIKRRRSLIHQGARAHLRWASRT